MIDERMEQLEVAMIQGEKQLSAARIRLANAEQDVTIRSRQLMEVDLELIAARKAFADYCQGVK